MSIQHLRKLLLSKWHHGQQARRAATIALALFLAGYLLLGFTTELEQIGRKPMPDHLIEDFGFYARAWNDARTTGDPYTVREIGYAFIYPPPALLIVGLYAPIASLMPRAAALITTDVVLLALTLYLVARRYGYTLEQVWWWFPLAFGFAPFLELLHLGQINVITQFGILLMFALEESAPFLGGVGLALGVVTKVTPLAFAGYLLASRKLRAIAGLAVGLAGLCLLAGLVYGWRPFVTYVDVLKSLLTTFIVDPNSQSLAALLQSHGWIGGGSLQAVQRALTVYMLVVFAASGCIAYFTREREPLFIVLSLGIMLIPNVLWYHHYVFFLLPLFVWMAWRRLHPAVVLWCLIGLAFIQVDRQYSFLQSSHGLLTHGFGHASILLVLGGQVRRAIGLLKTKPDLRERVSWTQISRMNTDKTNSV